MRRSTRGTSSSIDWIYVGALAFIVVSTLIALRFIDPLPPPEHGSNIPFNLHRPDRSYSLPSELKEISAVAVSPNEPVAWAVNDEQAKLFRIDLNDGSVQAGQKFGERGDYEGIEIVGDSIVIARSDGTLWQVSNDEVRKIESPLDERYDIEGLAYDKPNSRLLVAGKGKAGKGKVFKHTRAVHAVRLPSFEWAHSPAFVVKEAALREFIKEKGKGALRPGDAKSFAPSAIAVEPNSGDIYLLSSAGRMLVIVDALGEDIVAVTALPRDIHRQPEGLAFGPRGSLYVSNEGRGGQPILYRFDRVDNHQER